MHCDPSKRFAHIREFGRALLAVGDLRTLALWGPSFGRSLPAELVPGGTPLALSAPREVLRPAASGAEKATFAARPLWALALGLVGVFALWITFVQRGLAPPARSPEAGAALVKPEHRAAEPQVVTLPLNVPSEASPEAPEASPPEVVAPAQASSVARAVPAAPAPRLRARVSRGLAESAAPRRRAEAEALPSPSSESDDDRLREMFFPAPRTRPAQAGVIEAPVANEAPILD
jgi:hypothetical protein